MIILASTSPRRKEIMSLVGLKFKVVPSTFDENSFKWLGDGKDLPVQLAINKATDVFKRFPDDIVIASDTIVYIDGKILGKPKDTVDAEAMLSELSGQVHEVITGVSIMSKNKVVNFTSTTKVEFYPMTFKEISDYVKTYEPMDKAGAYAIQGIGAQFIKKIDGDYYTVMGLPIAKIMKYLKDF